MYKLFVFLIVAVTVTKSLNLNAKLGAKEQGETSTVAGEQGQNHTESSSVTTSPSITTTEAGPSNPSAFQKLICIAKCPLIANNQPVCDNDGNKYPSIGFFKCVKACGVKVNLNATRPCSTRTTLSLLL